MPCALAMFCREGRDRLEGKPVLFKASFRGETIVLAIGAGQAVSGQFMGMCWFGNQLVFIVTWIRHREISLPVGQILRRIEVGEMD